MTSRGPDSARIAAEGEFFTVYGRTFVQPFHARTGVPPAGRATSGGLAGSSPAGRHIDAVLIKATRDVAVRIGERIYTWDEFRNWLRDAA